MLKTEMYYFPRPVQEGIQKYGFRENVSFYAAVNKLIVQALRDEGLLKRTDCPHIENRRFYSNSKKNWYCLDCGRIHRGSRLPDDMSEGWEEIWYK